MSHQTGHSVYVYLLANLLVANKQCTSKSALMSDTVERYRWTNWVSSEHGC